MKKILRNLSNSGVIVLLLIFTLLTAFISVVIFQVPLTSGWWSSWFQNLSAGMAGTIITFWLLVLVVDKRDKREELEKIRVSEQKEYIIRLK